MCGRYGRRGDKQQIAEWMKQKSAEYYAALILDLEGKTNKIVASNLYNELDAEQAGLKARRTSAVQLA